MNIKDKSQFRFIHFLSLASTFSTDSTSGRKWLQRQSS